MKISYHDIGGQKYHDNDIITILARYKIKNDTSSVKKISKIAQSDEMYISLTQVISTCQDHSHYRLRLNDFEKKSNCDYFDRYCDFDFIRD